jgi:hypothetical protein
MGRIRSHNRHHVRAMRRQVLAAAAATRRKMTAPVWIRSEPAPVSDLRPRSAKHQPRG